MPCRKAVRSRICFAVISKRKSFPCNWGVVGTSISLLIFMRIDTWFFGSRFKQVMAYQLWKNMLWQWTITYSALNCFLASTLHCSDSTRKSGKRLVGDVEFSTAKEVASWITPVPGGVGPMTVAMLLSNTVQCAERALKQQVMFKSEIRSIICEFPWFFLQTTLYYQSTVYIDGMGIIIWCTVNNYDIWLITVWNYPHIVLQNADWNITYLPLHLETPVPRYLLNSLKLC